MSMFDNLKDQAGKLLGNEGQTDQAIQAVGNAIDERTGGQYADKIDQAQQALDDRVGDGGQGA